MAPGGGRDHGPAHRRCRWKTAYFDRFENNRPFHVDSVKLDADGEGTMQVAALPLDFYRISVGR